MIRQAVVGLKIDRQLSGTGVSRRLTLWVLLVGLVVSCGRPQEPTARPNLVLISVDSLRADHLGCYGYERATSPTIDRLAAEGVLLEIVTSSSSWTLPAHASLFTGLPDSVHGVDRGSRKLEPARRTLAEALGAAGYRTAGVWTGPLLSPRFGFGQGFDRYLSHAAEADDWQEAVDRSHREVTGPRVLEQVKGLLPFLTEEPEQPFFLFVHLWDVHYDYIPPPPYDERFTDPDYDGPITGRDLSELVLRGPDAVTADDVEQLRALYDGEIAWTDHQIELLLESLESAVSLDDTVVVVTADHGEEFFEHGRFGHKRQLFDESIRIPLIFWGPKYVAEGRRIQRLARIVDVAPTLVDLAGGEELPTVMGRSLAAELAVDETEPPDPPTRALAELVQDPEHDRSLLALRTSDWKLVLRAESGTPVGLWDLRQDPEERTNLVDTEPDLLRRAVAAVEQEMAEVRRLRSVHPLEGEANGPEELPDDLRAQLESLGYLDPGTAADAETRVWIDPDPLQVCDGTGLGVATVHWRVPGDERVEVRVGRGQSKLFVHGAPVGEATTGKWVRDGTRFSLVYRSSGEELASTVVRVTTDGCQDR